MSSKNDNVCLYITRNVCILPEISLHKVSNDISNIDHFALIQISYKKKHRYAALWVSDLYFMVP